MAVCCTIQPQTSLTVGLFYKNKATKWAPNRVPIFKILDVPDVAKTILFVLFSYDFVYRKTTKNHKKQVSKTSKNRPKARPWGVKMSSPFWAPAEDGPKTAQDASRRPQDDPKTAPWRLKMAPSPPVLVPDSTHHTHPSTHTKKVCQRQTSKITKVIVVGHLPNKSRQRR